MNKAACDSFMSIFGFHRVEDQEHFEEPIRDKFGMIGRKFGMLTAVSAAEPAPYKRNGKTYYLRRWACKCDCGGQSISYENGLKSGISTSCGCKRRKAFSEAGKNKKTHGMSKTKEYHAWLHLRQRCHDEKYYLFHKYGGRGISVCERWKDSFQNFIDDVGLAPSKDHSIDRVDSNGNYEPSNVRWATWKTQERNRTNNRIVEINGEEKSLAEWCEIYEINYHKVWARISKLGIDPLIALTSKQLKKGPKNVRG